MLKNLLALVLGIGIAAGLYVAAFGTLPHLGR